MKAFLFRYFPVCILAILMSACFNPPDFNDTPEISFESIRGVRAVDPLGNPQDSITITISFQDGDGDLGLDPADTLTPYQPFIVENGVTRVNFFHHNYHLTVKRLENGTPVEVSFLDGGRIRGRFPVLIDGSGPIEGQLNFGQYFFVSGSNNTLNTGDTLLFDVQIVDRALNISNTITTETIVLGDY